MCVNCNSESSTHNEKKILADQNPPKIKLLYKAAEGKKRKTERKFQWQRFLRPWFT